MASGRSLIFAAALLPALGALTFGQEQRPPVDPLANATPVPATPSAPGNPPGRAGRPDRPLRPNERMRRALGGGDAEKAREALRNMPPEERERWTKRFREWAAMPPERKKALQDREENLRRRMQNDAEKAITGANLSLTEDQKATFTQRYIEERRKIEEELRREMEEKRRPKVQALVEKLKGEFSVGATGQ
jgi:hypothetical protein